MLQQFAEDKNSCPASFLWAKSGSKMNAGTFWIRDIKLLMFDFNASTSCTYTFFQPLFIFLLHFIWTFLLLLIHYQVYKALPKNIFVYFLRKSFNTSTIRGMNANFWHIWRILSISRNIFHQFKYIIPKLFSNNSAKHHSILHISLLRFLVISFCASEL